ncbi:MAG: DNA integrity scanning protein DisA [Syntrophaceae bacterium PtaU1.Bin231]|nr:MAG: DNA integrity scanning protein DisA [Syntrophaceae bacterium PtaU1.Bin231]
MEWLHQLSAVYNVLRPVLDIAILALLLYKGYDLLIKTQAIQLIKGAGFLALVYAGAYFLKLNTLQWILNLLAPGLFIAIAIVFQPELRKIIMRLGQGEWFRPDAGPRLGQLEAVMTAAEILAEQRRGALIVFPRRVGLKNIIDTGTKLNADLSSGLIITIFAYDTPLHDGAVVIQNGRIVAASCVLPLSEQQDIRKSFGTRHRAALGMCEETDAVVLIVSEETGAISLAYDSKLHYDLSPFSLQKKLKDLFNPGREEDSDRSADAELKEPFLEE